MTAAEPAQSSRAEAIARHIETVEAILDQYGIPAEYNESYASDEDLYRIAMFKILPCPKNTQHDWSCCPYAHTNERARRRSLIVHLYYTKVCPDMQNTGECPRGEGCAMTHSMFEYWMHPQRYRTKLCREGTKCTRPFCFFAHTQEQLREGADEPTGMQLLQAFLPCRLNDTAHAACLPTTVFASSSSLACSALLPPIPGMQASRCVGTGRLAGSMLQQQSQEQQFMILSSTNPGCMPFLPSCNSACSVSHHNSPVASSSSCSSAISTVQLQPGHAMTLLASSSSSSSSGMSPNNSLGHSATVCYQPQQQLLMPQQQPLMPQQQLHHGHNWPAQQQQQQVYGQQYILSDSALATQVQQLHLGSDHAAINLTQAPTEVASTAMIVMPPQHAPHSAVVPGIVPPAVPTDLCAIGMQLVQPTSQQQQPEYQQQQQQLVILQPASSMYAADNAPSGMLNGASPSAAPVGTIVRSHHLASEQLSWCQGLELAPQGSTGSTGPQQMPLQAVQQSAMWLSQHSMLTPSTAGEMQQQVIATQAPASGVQVWGL